MSKVYLVGAGPGDPELLTLKGKRLLEEAGVILFDHLANEDLLRHARPDALRIYVGKKKSDHVVTQEEITNLLIQYAREGKTVVRLKGGDPFIFGRGGEEVEALADAGIPFEVVPGVTSPLGIAAYAGVPLTHREHTSVVTFITGHDPAQIDWSKVSGSETIVIFMGLAHAQDIVDRLVANGRNPETPAIAVRWGTRPEQETIAAPLHALPAAISAARMKPPATIIIGDVVSLRNKLNWYERLPLFGKKIVVTRAAAQSASFSHKLRSLGAQVIEFPVIEIRPPQDPAPLDAAIARLGEYDWLIFTSANGVRSFINRLDDLRKLKAKICAIGPATREAVEQLQIKVDLTPDEYVAESLLKAFANCELAGKRMLLPRAAVARDLIPVELAKRGARIDVVEAYRTGMPEPPPTLAVTPDWITFTSSSTVNNFLALLPDRGLIAHARIASIGPITSAAARSHGLEVHAEAVEYTTDGLVQALLSCQ